MSIIRLLFTLFWVGLLGVFLSVILCNITLAVSSNNHKRTKKIVSVLVAFTFANIFRMCVQECYNFDNATVESVAKIVYDGDNIIINGKKVSVDCAYSNKSITQDMLVNCNKLTNSFIPGIFTGSNKANILIVSNNTMKDVYNYIPSIEDDVVFFEATKFGLEHSANTVYEIKKDSKEKVSNISVDLDVHLRQLEQSNLETIKKLDRLESEIKEIKNQSTERHTNMALMVIIVLVVIWIMGLLTYIVIVKVNARIKRDLINTSSDAKIREGVMLDK